MPERRSTTEIAADIVEQIGGDHFAIEVMLRNIAETFPALRHLAKLKAIKADVEVELRRLQRLRKYAEVAFLAQTLDRATRDLEMVDGWTGPDPHFYVSKQGLRYRRTGHDPTLARHSPR